MKAGRNATRPAFEAIAGACGLLATLGCLGLLLADSLHQPIDSFAYRLIDNTLFVSALLSLAVAFARTEPSENDRKSSHTLVFFIGTGTVILILAAVAVHYRGFSTYPTLTAFVTSLAAVTMVVILNASREAEIRPAMVDRKLSRVTLLMWLLAGATIAIRLLTPGTGFLMWVLAPVYVLMMPGLGLGAALLPSSTDWTERLIWAPALSLGFQVVILMWMNTLGLAVSVPTIFVLAGATSFLGTVAAMLRHDELPL